jgi:hypothetical protein
LLFLREAVSVQETRDTHVTLGTLAVMGQGHIGLQVALRAASVGWRVTGFDLDEDLVKSLNAGIHLFPEDDFSELLTRSLEAETYRATNQPSQLAGFSVALLCIPGLGGSKDRLHPAILQCCEVLGPMISKGCLISLESTVPPGTTAGPVRTSLEREKGECHEGQGCIKPVIRPSKTKRERHDHAGPCCPEALLTSSHAVGLDPCEPRTGQRDHGKEREGQRGQGT